MEPHIEYVKTALDARMRVTPKGFPYWYGRDLMEILAYARWENFREVIDKAIQACDSSGKFSSNHFRYITEMIEAGKGAKKKRENAVLSRYACYLIAMNGDSSLPQVGTAQTYFAVQTRTQEIEQSLTDQQRRLLIRNRVKDANKKLVGAAKAAGVRRFPIFHDAGYKGLYGGRGRDDIKRIKGIATAEELLDCIDREELAANEFRITQTESKLKRDGIQGEENAINTHFNVGRKVRQAIQGIHGTMPEKLPRAPSIKKISEKQAKDSDKLELESGEG
ncbi:MAG TPA: DNA damage-inducible protein D [Candidatus Acidoferrales bacterium]|nr:DNA damage-inducible protein D [Candidatus Acidoferrales bacterium]